MEDTPDDRIIASWDGTATCKKNLSVIVLSTNVQIVGRLSEALTTVHSKGKYTWELLVLRALNLESIVKQTNLTGTVAMDLVILALDTSKIFCLEWAKKTLSEVHPDMRKRRVVLVNASGLPINKMAVYADELLNFSNEYKVDIVTGNVFQPDEAHFLAQRLLTYGEVSVGVKTGLPNINV